MLYCDEMNTEIEAKFLHMDHEKIREKLRDLDFLCAAPMRLMRRAIIDYTDRRLETGAVNAYIRIRDEGDRVTLAYKQFDSLSINGAQEVEVTVSSFEDAVEIFTRAGLEVVSLQESKRETWRSDTCEVVLDEWPWLDPYIEIEAKTESEVRNVAVRLGLTWSEAVFGDVMVAYRNQYPHLNETQTIGKLERVLFGMPLPSLLAEQE